MHLSHLTLTGADDSVDPAALAQLSDEAPLLEWGVLFSAEHEGRPRFPSSAWREAFYRAAPRARRAAHLCGLTMLADTAEAGNSRSQPIGRELRGDDLPDGFDAGPYQRMQLNFDVRELPVAVLTTWTAAWRAGRWRDRSGSPMGLITQHNDANVCVRALFKQGPAEAAANNHARSTGRAPATSETGARYAAHYAVLFDASGGRGASPRTWSPPIPGLVCGYAGGLGPDNLAAQLASIASVTGPQASIWIDMEAKLRGPDDRFDLDRVRAVLDVVRSLAGGSPLRPGVKLHTIAMNTAP